MWQWEVRGVAMGGLLTAPPEVSLMSAVGGSFSHVCVARLAL